MAATSIPLCALADLIEDEPLRVTPEGVEPLALVLSEGEVFAISDTCTHGDASLCDGLVEDGVIYCPFHSGSFDIRSGDVVDPPCVDALKTYRVAIEGGQVVLVSTTPERSPA